MSLQKKTFNGWHLLTGFAAAVIIVTGINLAQSVIVIFLISLFLALLGISPLLWLKEKRVPSGLAVLVVMTFMVVIVALISIQIGASFNRFVDEMPALRVSINEQIAGFVLFMKSKGVVVSEKIILDYINPEAVLRFTAGMLSGLGSLVSDLVLILLTVTFILLEVSSFPVKLRSILGDPEQLFPQFTKFASDIKHYMFIKTLINLAAGTLIGIWMGVLGVQFPALWGFLAFLLHYIPNIGSVIAAIPAAVLALVQLGMGSALLVVAGNLVIGFVIGNVIEPRIMGRKLGLSTLVVFLSLLFWGSLLGITGAILCIPLTMTLKFAFENNESTQWIGILLGSEKIKKTSLKSVKEE